MKINIVLFQPEIPQNTGNISRTCSATGSALHLIHPLGFSLDEKHLRRAGLDYWNGLEIHQYENNQAFFEKHLAKPIWYFSQKAPQSLWDADILPSNWKNESSELFLAFGPESCGLDQTFLEKNLNSCLRIPMLDGKRSLNLSNCVAIAVYEALRQTNFFGLKTQGVLAHQTSLKTQQSNTQLSGVPHV